MSGHSGEQVTIGRDELNMLRAEVRRLRREVARQQMLRQIAENEAHPEPLRTFTREELAAEWGLRD